MALVLKDRIKETSSTTGTGTLTLGGAVDGFRSFADIGDGNTTYYCIADGNNFEVGIGTYTASGTTLARTTVLQTSAGNTTKITCTGNQKVFVTQPASKAAYLDANNELVVNNTPLSTIQQRWTKTASSNQTAFSGAADNSGPTLAVNSTSHVFLNGIFLKETTDYALSGGTTVTLTAGATVNDIVEVITFTPLTTATTGITSGKVPVFTSGVVDNDFLKIDGTTVEGRSASEVLSDIGGQSALTFGISSGNVPTFTSGVADNDFLKIDGTTIEGRSASEVASDIGISTFGATLVDDASASAARTTLGLGSLATLSTISESNISPSAVTQNKIDGEAINEGRLQVSNAPVNGYFLQAQSSNTGGLTWAIPTDTNTTYSAGSGIDLNGTTFSHTDTSSQSSSNNSGRTYIQDITLDTYGHVTGIATATETVTDTNTTYSGGTNISLSGTTFNLDNSITLSGTAQATRYYIDGTSKFIDSVNGDYGTIRVEGATGSNEGYAIRDDFVFMSSGTGSCGIYNDIDNEWMALFYRNDYVELRDNGVNVFRTDDHGIWVRSRITNSDGYVYLGSSAEARLVNDEGTALYLRNGANENIIYGAENSHTYLYFDAGWTLRTNSSGILVRDKNTTSDATIELGDQAHAQIYNDEGTSFRIRNGASENFIFSNENSYTYLYYNGSWRLRASNQGITINGALATGASDTAYGTSGQVLKSNGSSAPTWVSPSTLSGVGGVWEEVSNTNFSGVTQVNISVSTGYLYNIIFSDLLITSSTNAARFDFKAITSSSTLQGFRASRNRISNSTSLQTYYTNILQTSNIALGYSNNVARQNNGTKSQTFDFWYHQGSTNTSNNNWASFWCTGWGQGAITVNPVVDICHGYQYQSGGATIATLGFFASTTTIQGNYRVLRIQV